MNGFKLLRFIAFGLAVGGIYRGIAGRETRSIRISTM